MATVKLWELAHARTGDKGNTANVSLIAYDPMHYDVLRRKVTADVVKRHFKGVVQGDVTRYELPDICAFNFILEKALCGGVTSSIALDTHGKTLSSALLNLSIEI